MSKLPAAPSASVWSALHRKIAKGEEEIERKLLQSSGRGGKDGFVPSKASRSNGNGHRKVRPHSATACRLCLLQGLQR